MLFYTIGQIHVFLWMVGAGLVIGALYMFFSGVRRLLCAGFWLSLLTDALFGLCAAVVLIIAALTADYGRIRPYELLGVVLGAILFELGICPPIRRIAQAASCTLRSIGQRIANFRTIKVIFK